MENEGLTTESLFLDRTAVKGGVSFWKNGPRGVALDRSSRCVGRRRSGSGWPSSAPPRRCRVASLWKRAAPRLRRRRIVRLLRRARRWRRHRWGRRGGMWPVRECAGWRLRGNREQFPCDGFCRSLYPNVWWSVEERIEDAAPAFACCLAPGCDYGCSCKLAIVLDPSQFAPSLACQIKVVPFRVVQLNPIAGGGGPLRVQGASARRVCCLFVSAT